MFYLPRICEHCLNPSCVASCPSGAMYKRDRGRHRAGRPGPVPGWRMCVSGCPYKKVYFNHKTGKAEKCTFCYPRIEVGLPTVCAETCVGRLRYIGLVLYDVDRVLAAASVENDTDLYEAQRQILLDPTDPEVIAGARTPRASPTSGSRPRSRSPVYALINTYRVALPLHPEYRTMPMVWYIPPLSPVVDAVSRDGHDGEDLGNLFGALEALRIPIEYLAGLFTAGDTAAVDGGAAPKLAAMRSYMRDINLGREPQPHIPAVGRHDRGTDVRDVPAARPSRNTRSATSFRRPTRAEGHRLEETVTECALDLRGRSGHVLSRGRSARPAADRCPSRWRPSTRCGSGRPAKAWPPTPSHPSRVNLLNWDGKGAPDGHVPRDGRPAMRLRDPSATRRHGRPAGSAGLAGRVAAAGLPRRATRRAAATPSTSCAPPSPDLRRTCWPRAVDGAACTADPIEARGRLRRNLRPAKRRSTLYLTYWTTGDTRNRGMAMLAFAELYRDAGVAGHPPARRPTTCRCVLEFAATVDPDARATAAASSTGCRSTCCATRLTDCAVAATPRPCGGVRDAAAGHRPATCDGRSGWRRPARPPKRLACNRSR